MSEAEQQRGGGPPDERAGGIPDGVERLIVDGFNALGSRPDGWWRDRPRAMAALVGRLARLAEQRPALRVGVVFDGRPHAAVEAAAEGTGVEVGFAGPGADAADRLIAAMVREDSAPGAALVVSSDRRLVAAVKAAGGRSTGAGGFVRETLGD